MLDVLFLVDHAVGISGPHRNVVGSLNALSARDDVRVKLLCGRIDESEPYAQSDSVAITLGFNPHIPTRVLANVNRIRKTVKDCEVIYVPTGLKSFLYAQFVRSSRKLVAGPNVTPLPLGNPDSPGKIELNLMCDAWFEASRWRCERVNRHSKAKKVAFIHHAIDHKKFSPNHRSSEIWNKFSIPIDATKVLYVGRDNTLIKGVERLLDAVEYITTTQKLYNDVHFVFVGNLSEKNQQRILGLKNTHALGFRQGSELAILYASSDVSVVPSSWENMPFSVLEAMASGLPVIASRTGGIPEQIISGESGLLVNIVRNGTYKPDAAQILAEAILKLTKNPDLRNKLGRGARERIVNHFNETRLGEELSEIFHQVTA